LAAIILDLVGRGEMLLVGDIGGTKTNLAIFSQDSGPRTPLAEATFPSAHYDSLELMVREFLEQAHLAADRASFAVAGPVVGGRAKITNLPWVIEEDRLQTELNLTSVDLWNDLEAIAYSVLFLEPGDVDTLNAGQPEPQGTIAIIAPGTGLGEGYMTWDGSRYRAHPSEGGHTDFAPTSDLQIDLLRYLRRDHEHVSYERVCSGIGLPNIYTYLRESGQAPEPAWLAEQLASTEDHTPVIVNAALDATKRCELCVTALDTFASVLATESANLALKVLSTGGVYLGGGIPPRILPVLKQPSFMQAFLDKGRMSSLLSRMPVHVILNPKAALLGAACLGLGL
jgi:glucokinase